MGIHATLRIIRPGYVPRGGGQIEVEISPLRKPLTPLNLAVQGRSPEIRGIALSSMYPALRSMLRRDCGW
jgi:RNA 3'-terminal phosphate cyclase (ATP)